MTMRGKLLKRAWIPLVAWLSLWGLNRIAEAQQLGGGGAGVGMTGRGGQGLGGGGGLAGGAGASGGFAGGSGQGGEGAGFSGAQGGFSGTTQGAAIATPKTGAAIPATENLFRNFYLNPLSKGLPSTGAAGAKGAATGTFGQPLYAPATTSTTTSTARKTTNNSSKVGFSTYGMNRDTPYITDLSEDIPLVARPTNGLQTDLKDIVKRSSFLKNHDKINVSMEGGVVVVRGQVGSERERRLVETMLLLEPGVFELRNELTLGNR
jgi:hypothetical protein